MSLRYINNNSQEIAIAGQGANGRDGEGVHVGTIIGYNGSANSIPEGYEIVENVSFGSGMPIGSGCDYYGTTPPEDFLFADGSAISRTTYAKLFAIIGTTYGAGNGSTTFNLPDKREAVTIMKGTTYATLGQSVGGNTKTITEANLPNITGSFTVSNQVLRNGYGQAINSADGKMTASTVSQSTVYYGRTDAINNSSAAQTIKDKVTMSFGSGTAFNVMQKTLVCNYIIKVK